ncbi:hypothetical protein [Williamsia soli]|uniref:hypothetical protein n=1 Tax=Williamsia soli TaxID=364929 RepID=UPI001A9F0F1E|nr:hypothetical protein [Williamsia soli]
MSYDVSVTDDNLSARPQEYPGRLVPGPGLLHEGRFSTALGVDDLTDVLRRHGLADLAGRTAVLAIGSNACAAVVLRKLESVGVDATVPFLSGSAPGVSVGHSGHRSVAGYIPAAPYATVDTRNTFIINMFSGQQLAAIDETEPNYRRITVECDLAGRGSAELYVSRWGVIAPPGGPVLSLMSQTTLCRRLSDQCRGFQEAQADVNTRTVADLLIERGWARDPGLG